MNLETRKQALMDQLSEAYFSAIELKAEAEKYLAELEANQEGIYLDQQEVQRLIDAISPLVFIAIAALDEVPDQFPKP